MATTRRTFLVSGGAAVAAAAVGVVDVGKEPARMKKMRRAML